MNNKKSVIPTTDYKNLVGAAAIFVIPSLIVAVFRLILAATVYELGM